MPDLSSDEKKFAYFWIIVFASAIGFWGFLLKYAVAFIGGIFR